MKSIRTITLLVFLGLLGISQSAMLKQPDRPNLKSEIKSMRKNKKRLISETLTVWEGMITG